MVETKKKTEPCPECNQPMWYDEEYECWVCDECELEFYEDENYDEEESDDDEGW